jgi:hypothetical protein
MFSLSGACIFEANVIINGTEAILPLPSHAAGVYAIQIETNSQELKGSQLVRL